MKQTKQIIFLTIVIALLCTTKVSAQVTIGTGGAPETGALLQLKENASTTNNSSRGLGMPRVKLTSKTNLYPMFETEVGSGVANAYYNNEALKTAEDGKHTGLLVYNLTNQGFFCPGLYVWDSQEWQRLGAECFNSFALNIDNLFFDFASGKDLRPLTAAQKKTSLVSWASSSEATVVWGNNVSGLLDRVLFTNTTIYPTATLSLSPATLNF